MYIEVMKKAVKAGYTSSSISSKTQKLSIKLVLYDIQRWLREKHKIHIEVIGFVGVFPADISYSYRLRDLTEHDSFLFLPENEDNYDTYEECLEMGLYKSLTLIKERNESK